MANEPEEYWSEDMDYPLVDWKYEVQNDDTRLGYWEWVAGKREEAEHGAAQGV